MAALPIYLIVPNFYATSVGLNLAVVGLVLLLARLLDAILDPLIGALSDRHATRHGGRQRFVLAGLPFLAAGLVGLFMPPAMPPAAGVAWLAVTAAVAYLGYSLVSVSYHAWGAELTDDPMLQARLCGLREGCALLGVLGAASLPALWLSWWGPRQAYATFAWTFVGVLGLAGAVTLAWGPRAPVAALPVTSGSSAPLLLRWRVPFANPAFRRLACVFVVNGLAVSIPSTVFLFFVKDVLGRLDLAGMFLAVYFLAAACGMPLWLAIARRTSLLRAWQAGMLLSVAAFVWAFFLGHGDTAGFLVVCVASGFALGADLAFPPALLAGVIDANAAADGRTNAGSYFGWWNLLTKLNLALAAGVALPLLALLGYTPGRETGNATLPLSAVYALLPCGLKLLAAALSPRVQPRRAAASLATREVDP